MKTLFWISLAVILYAYAGYPLLLWLITRPIRRHKQQDEANEYHPRVTLIISAYNEEKDIEDKLLNSLALDYPRELLELVVVSDGSQDATDRIVRQYAGSGVVLKRYEGRIGKTACLNRTVPFVSGEIIVFSDANSQYAENAIKELVKHFKDRSVGFATGSTQYVSGDDSAVMDTVGLYSRIERVTKTLETELSSCVGADGALFAIRKNLYKKLRSVDINDLVIPLSIIERGLRGVFASKAICLEYTAKDAQGEFKRQVRITTRTIRALLHARSLFNPFRYGTFAFMLFSHKAVKLAVPFFLLLMLLASAALAVGSWFYAAMFAGQAVLYLIGWSGRSPRYGKGLSRAISIVETFVTVNAAILQGWVKFIQGETYTVWKTAR